MQVSLRLAEPFWRAVGQRELELELAKGSRVSDLLGLLHSRYPALEQEFVEAPPIVFVGEQEADMETVLKPRVQVHLVWAVAGG